MKRFDRRISQQGKSHSTAAPEPRGFRSSRRRISGTLLALCMALSIGQASAQSLRPLRIIVAIVPGGAPDVMARQLARQLTLDTGRTVIVENRPGAFGAVAANMIATSAADGSTVLLVESGAYAIAPHLTKNNPFDALVPVALVASTPLYLCVNATLGINNVKDFISYIKSNPKTPYGSSGIGSSHQLAMEALRYDIGADMVHVPYTGAGQTVVALIANEVKTAFLGYQLAAPNAAAGRIKILAVATAKRNSLTPNIPTIGESGGPPLDLPIQIGTFVNAKTPPAIINALNRDLSKAANSPAVRSQYAQMGFLAADGTVDAKQYAGMVQRDYKNYGSLVQSINLKMN